MKRESCVLWTLRKINASIKEFEGVSINDNNKIMTNEKFYQDSGIIQRLFESFLSIANNPKKGDVVVHSKGSGIYINDIIFYTLDIRGKEKYLPLPEEYTIYKVSNE